MENINKSHGGSCVKCRVQSPGVAPAATALRKQEIIQVDTKKGNVILGVVHISVIVSQATEWKSWAQLKLSQLNIQLKGIKCFITDGWGLLDKDTECKSISSGGKNNG